MSDCASQCATPVSPICGTCLRCAGCVEDDGETGKRCPGCKRRAPALCSADCGKLTKGAVCPVCLCCRSCAKSYDYAPGGVMSKKPCPGCGLNPASVKPKAKKPVKRKKARAR